MWSMVIHARWISGKSPMNMWYSSCSLAACFSVVASAVMVWLWGPP